MLNINSLLVNSLGIYLIHNIYVFSNFTMLTLVLFPAFGYCE